MSANDQRASDRRADGRSDDPYRDRKKYHMAGKVNGRGGVSPACAKVPRALSLRRGESWTLRWEAVTCQACLALRPEGGSDAE